jgi:hemerythrin-like metal-binding protein
MALLEWHKEFEIGLPAIDFEHRQLIELINALHDELTGGSEAETVLQFFADVHAAIAAHFALEERMMREQKYARYEDHKADHEELLDQINDIMQGYEQGSYDAQIDRLSRELGDWFSIHFRDKDAALHRQLGH